MISEKYLIKIAESKSWKAFENFPNTILNLLKSYFKYLQKLNYGYKIEKKRKPVKNFYIKIN